MASRIIFRIGVVPVCAKIGIIELGSRVIGCLQKLHSIEYFLVV